MTRVYIVNFNFINRIQSTPGNSNLLGKSKKVRVIGSSKQITGNKKKNKWMEGEGKQVSCTLHFQEQQEIE